MTLDNLALYTAASFVLAVTPGPTMLLALTNGISIGMKRALWGIAGALLGSSLVIAAVALGLGSLLAASTLLFEVLRYAGIAYLLWLAVKIWRSPPLNLDAAMAASTLRTKSDFATFARCLMVALSNPKSMLFFAAFLPQFVDVAHPQAPQYALLGAIFIGLDSVIMVGYAAAGTQAMRWLSRRSVHIINRSCAVAMGLLAATLAMWRRPGA